MAAHSSRKRLIKNVFFLLAAMIIHLKLAIFMSDI